MGERVALRELRLRLRPSYAGDELQIWALAWSLSQYPRPLSAAGGRLWPVAGDYELSDDEQYAVPLPDALRAALDAEGPVDSAVLAGLLPTAIVAQAYEVVRWSGGFGRVVFETASASLKRWPFETALRTRLGPGWLEARACFVRRRPGSPGRAAVGHPLTVWLAGGEPEASLFDDGFVAHARAQGGFAVVRQPDTAAPGILHVAGSIRPDGAPVRLLVLHRRDGAGPSACELLAAHAETADHAVLVVDEPAPSGFFPSLYRKLLHEWPLDRCLQAGLEAAAGSGVAAWLALRPGAECDLLLSHLAAERAGVLQLPDYPDEDAPFLERPEMAAVGADGLDDPAVTTPAASPPRSLRVRDEVLRHTRALVDDARGAVAREAESLSNQSFDAETHSLAAIVGREGSLANLAERATSMEHARDAVVESDDVELAAATARFTQAWLERPGAAEPLASGSILRLGETLSAKVQIRGRKLAGAFATAFPQAALAALTPVDRQIDLTVRFFHDARLELGAEVGTLRLPPVGDSAVVEVAVVVRQAGPVALRVALYFGNVMLQSVALEAWVAVADEDAPAVGPAGLRFRLDYAATADFLLLDELEQPALSVFTNDAAGSHWVGVFSSEDEALRQSGLHTFASEQLKALAKLARGALAQAHGTPETGYLYEGDAADTNERAVREQTLVRLAVSGWTLYDALFRSNPDAAPPEQKKALVEALRAPGLISVARCRGESTSMPWAAIYDYRIDTGDLSALSWCGQAAAELTAGLPDALACRERPECPLADPKKARFTVCPYGFWGFRHRLEQPLDALPAPSEGAAGAVPTELVAGRERARLVVTGEKVPLVFGFDPALAVAQAHRQELAAVSAGLALAAHEDRYEVQEALDLESAAIFYLLCHGVVRDNTFKLVLRSEGKEVTLSSADLGDGIPPGRPPFLVVLNACESVATTPEVIHQLIWAFENLGAIGVVGTEVMVATPFAVEFGRRLVAGLVEGRAIGETFLAIRRELMKELNPSGLLYTHHSVAGLRVVRV